MDQYNSMHSDRSGGRLPYYLLRDKKPLEVYQSIDGKLSFDHQPSTSRERTFESARVPSNERSQKSSRALLDSGSQTKSSIQKHLYENFFNQLMAKNNSVQKKPPLASSRKRSPEGDLTGRSVNKGPLKVQINPNPNKFNYKKPAHSKRELMQTLSPKFVIDSIYSFEYINKHSYQEPKTARGLSFNNGNLTRKASKANISVADDDQSKVLNRLYDHKSIIANFATAPIGPQLLGVKNIISRAENSTNRSFQNNQSTSFMQSSRAQSPRMNTSRHSKLDHHRKSPPLHPQIISYNTEPMPLQPQVRLSPQKKNNIPMIDGIPASRLTPTVTLTTTNTRRTGHNDSEIPDYEDMQMIHHVGDENLHPNVFEGFGAYFNNNGNTGISRVEEDYENENPRFSSENYIRDSYRGEPQSYQPSQNKVASFHDALKSIVLKGGQAPKRK